MLWDPIRKIEVTDTAEERVRQAVVNYLVNQLKVPARLIAVELSLAHFSTNKRLRVDVVVFQPAAHDLIQTDQNQVITSTGGLRAWLLVECKAPHVPVDESVARQMERYQVILPSQFVLVTNGSENIHLERVKQQWIWREGLPIFSFA